MTFSKAIQIKEMVNRWNHDRWNLGYGYVKFECSMYRIGSWSVDLKSINPSLFFSLEMDELVTLYAGGGFHMVINAYGNKPRIMMQ